MTRKSVVWLGISAVVFSACFAVAKGAARPEEEKITMRVPAGFRAKEGTTPEPYTHTGWAKEVIHEKTGMEMVFIPAGEFMMGSAFSETPRDYDEGPEHRVKITKPFYLGKYEVTQGDWLKIMGSNPSHFKGNQRLPVERVSWDDCQEFLSRAGDGLRLPTEAQWEYACRVGTTTPFHFGNTISTEQANYDGNYPYGDGPKGVFREKTMPVGSFPPNAWGLYDMHGNVYEWCQDWYDEEYYEKSPEEDPVGPDGGGGRVLRGGSWNASYGARLCRSANRGRRDPTYRHDSNGFRAALGLK
jgi:formylglycine-generating enzyme required for sulfatase activity